MINSIDGLFASQAYDTESSKKTQRSQDEQKSLWNTTDTVQLSEEAYEKLAEMRKLDKARILEQQAKEQDNSQFAAASGTKIKASDTSSGAEALSAPGSSAGGGGTSSGSEDSSDAISALQKQVEQLSAKLQNVATSSMPEVPKNSAMQTYQQQIQQLQQQINEIKSASQKQG